MGKTVASAVWTATFTIMIYVIFVKMGVRCAGMPSLVIPVRRTDILRMRIINVRRVLLDVSLVPTGKRVQLARLTGTLRTKTTSVPSAKYKTA